MLSSNRKTCKDLFQEMANSNVEVVDYNCNNNCIFGTYLLKINS